VSLNKKLPANNTEILLCSKLCKQALCRCVARTFYCHS